MYLKLSLLLLCITEYTLSSVQYTSAYFRNCYFLPRIDINHAIFVCASLRLFSDVSKYFELELNATRLKMFRLTK